jgi:hypothetical protein
MTLSMNSSNWLDFLESEYLASFIKDGGSAIKFAVPLEDDIAATLAFEIKARATQLGYVVAHVDSGLTRVHMVEQLFFSVAEQIPWRETVQRVVVRLAEAEGYAPPAPGDALLFHRLADANGLATDFLLMDLRRKLRSKVETHVFHDKGLAKDFRVAMTHLALAELAGAQEATMTYGVLTDWLCGRNRVVSAVKPFQIFSRITRGNARYLFESLLVWLAFAGYSGLALTIDISRISVVRNPKDELLHYTRAGVVDAYELLRQFIDGTDRLENCLIVVVPDPDFLDEDVLGRGFATYPALQFRVYDEVRDRSLVNPMASLVRLTGTEEVVR